MRRARGAAQNFCNRHRVVRRAARPSRTGDNHGIRQGSRQASTGPRARRQARRAHRARRQADLRCLRHPGAARRCRQVGRRGQRAGAEDGRPGGAEDRVARHPAQDRGRRRAGGPEERRRRGQGLRHDSRQRQEVQGRRQGRRRAGAADAGWRAGGDRRRGHRRQLRQAGGVRPGRRAGRGAEGHHVPPGTGHAERCALACSTASRPPKC